MLPSSCRFTATFYRIIAQLPYYRLFWRGSKSHSTEEAKANKVLRRGEGALMI